MADFELSFVLRTIFRISFTAGLIWQFTHRAVHAETALIDEAPPPLAEKAIGCTWKLRTLAPVSIGTPQIADVRVRVTKSSPNPIHRTAGKVAVRSAVLNLDILRKFAVVFEPTIARMPSGSVRDLADGIFVFGITRSGKFGFLPRNLVHEGLEINPSKLPDIFAGDSSKVPESFHRDIETRGLDIFGQEGKTKDSEILSSFALLNRDAKYVGTHDGLLLVLTDGKPLSDDYIATGSFKVRGGKIIHLTNSSGSFPSNGNRLPLIVAEFQHLGMPTDSKIQITDFSTKANDPHGAAPVQVQVDLWAWQSPTLKELVREISEYIRAYPRAFSEDFASEIAWRKDLWKSKRFQFGDVMDAGALVSAWSLWTEDSDANIIVHKALIRNGGRQSWERIKAVLEAVRN